MCANRIVWLDPADPPDTFPSVEQALADPDGLLAAGGNLGVERLLAAYRRGIFPWYSEGQPILWWSPDPRCVLCPGELRLSRRLRRYARGSAASVRFNTAFDEVVQGCAAERRSQLGTWITPEMRHAYARLHAEGWAHSIEVWQADRLVGGLYGVGIGRVFFGESMFSAAPNASKFALCGLARYLLEHDGELIDCQVASPHLFTLGARLLPRRDFVAILDTACEPPARLENWPLHPISVAELAAGL